MAVATRVINSDVLIAQVIIIKRQITVVLSVLIDFQAAICAILPFV
jgi:hypothetical protein